MATEILFGRKTPLRFFKSSVGALQNDAGQLPPAYLSLDATPRETHTYANEMSSYPIEDGATITDFIRRVPEGLSIDGFITNAPVPYLEINQDPLSSGTQSANIDRVRPAFEMLLQLAGYKIGELGKGVVIPSEALLVDIVTGLRAYTNMVLIKLDVPRDATTGDALRFTAEFRKMDKVQLQTTIVQPVVEKKPAAAGAAKQNAGTVSNGSQSTATAKAKATSAARKALDASAAFLQG